MGGQKLRHEDFPTTHAVKSKKMENRNNSKSKSSSSKKTTEDGTVKESTPLTDSSLETEKEIENASDGQEHIHESRGESLYGSHWKVIAATAAGTSHVKEGIPCQDAFAFDVLPDGVLIAAVSDGAGSKPRSGEGASIATREAVLSVKKRLSSGIRGHLMKTVRSAAEDALEVIEARASEEGMQPGEFASTLIMVIATNRWAAGFQIGDGTSIIKFGNSNPDGSENRSYSVLTQPQRGQYANWTYFLTSEGRIDKAEESEIIGDLEGIIMVTDGLQGHALDHEKPRDTFLNSLYSYVQNQKSDEFESKAHVGIEDLLKNKRVTKYTSDDTTVLVANLLPRQDEEK